MSNDWYRRDGDSLALNLHVQPGAKRTEITGLHGPALKIRLAVPPVDGRANKALLKFIAELFDVPSRQVALQRGVRSHHKVVMVECSCIDPEGIIAAKADSGIV